MGKHCAYSCGTCKGGAAGAVSGRVEFGQECMDGLDNDQDERTDCQDVDCAKHPVCLMTRKQLNVVFGS